MKKGIPKSLAIGLSVLLVIALFFGALAIPVHALSAKVRNVDKEFSEFYSKDVYFLDADKSYNASVGYNNVFQNTAIFSDKLSISTLNLMGEISVRSDSGIVKTLRARHKDNKVVVCDTDDKLEFLLFSYSFKNNRLKIDVDNDVNDYFFLDEQTGEQFVFERVLETVCFSMTFSNSKNTESIELVFVLFEPVIYLNSEVIF